MKRTWLFSTGLLSLVLFVGLGIIAKSGPLAIDTSVARWFKDHRTVGEVHWAQMISALTTPIIVLTAIVLLLLYLNYWFRSWYVSDFIPLALFLSCAIITSVAKPFFHRERPGAGLTTLFDFEPSYPSSHVVFVAAAGCSLLIFAGQRQFSIAIIVALVSGFIGLNRLVLGVHWFTDLVGGALLAFGMMALFYVLDDWLAERERNRL